MPAVFLGHGNPMNAIQHKAYTDAWRALAATLPRQAGHGVPFRTDVRRTPPREATQIPERSSPVVRSPVGCRPPACHNDPPCATRPSPKDAPSDAPAYLAFSAAVPTPRG